MTLWILENELTSQVINDLCVICPDTTLQIAIGVQENESKEFGMTCYGNGQVTFGTNDGLPSTSSIGTNLIAFLVKCPEWIGIRGESSIFGTHPAHRLTLKDIAGECVFDQYPGAKTIDIVYDVTGCFSNGFWVLDSKNNQIPFPPHVILFHELSHAEDIIKCTLNLSNPEPFAIDRENQFRDTLELKLRKGHSGGCYSEPIDDDCFVATAAYGSHIEPEVQFLRNFRDNTLRKTRIGKTEIDRFYEHYKHIGPFIVSLMAKDPEIKRIVKWGIANPIVKFLKIFTTFPDAEIDYLEEPWRSFLLELRNDLEKSAKLIDIPYNFSNLSSESAAEEIGLLLRYVFRTSTSRDAYLRSLETLGQIPLHISLEEKEIITGKLRMLGISEEEFGRLLNEIKN
ncbi:hypothetical protein KAR91_45360 [Candidatus Pacearchaeota archaeon]|nr:hypothetical protein [Candidatus Pacearchaeota archaeon]